MSITYYVAVGNFGDMAKALREETK